MGSQYIKSMELSLLEDSVKIEELESQVASLTSEIAMLREKVKELEKFGADMIVQATCAEEKGAREMAEAIKEHWEFFDGINEHLPPIDVDNYMQLWKEARGK